MYIKPFFFKSVIIINKTAKCVVHRSPYIIGSFRNNTWHLQDMDPQRFVDLFTNWQLLPSTLLPNWLDLILAKKMCILENVTFVSNSRALQGVINKYKSLLIVAFVPKSVFLIYVFISLKLCENDLIQRLNNKEIKKYI